MIYLSSGRRALELGLRQLEFKIQDKLLVPELICSAVVEPLNEIGVTPVYYPVQDDLTPNWSKTQELVDGRVKGIIMVHYFGQPQNIDDFRKFCDNHSIYLIEDNAHGYSGK